MLIRVLCCFAVVVAQVALENAVGGRCVRSSRKANKVGEDCMLHAMSRAAEKAKSEITSLTWVQRLSTVILCLA